MFPERILCARHRARCKELLKEMQGRRSPCVKRQLEVQPETQKRRDSGSREVQEGFPEVGTFEQG